MPAPKRLLSLLAALTATLGLGHSPDLDPARDPVEQLERLSKKKRQAALDELWPKLVEQKRIPWREDDRAVFLYRGEDVDSVQVAGDHTRWSPRDELERLDGTDLWWRADTFTTTARIDYKLVVDEQWMLDPNNPDRQRSGFGDNSELAMPGFECSPWTASREGDAPELERISVASEILDRDVTVRLHRPDPEVVGDRALAVLIVSDGHEYADDSLGALPLVADRLLAAGRMRPTLCVFVDPRDTKGTNRRASELGGSGRFGRFVASELLDELERRLGRDLPRDDVATLGTSLGGVASALTYAAAPERIGRVGIHSPALWVAPGKSEDGLLDSGPKPSQVFLAFGTVNDGGEASKKLADRLEKARVPLKTVVADQGHSWGLWSWVMADTLEALLPPR